MADKHAWQVQARTRIDWLRQELREAARRRGGILNESTGALEAPTPRDQDEDYDSAFAEIWERLEDASSRLTPSGDPVAWLRGTRVEGTWSNIHSAHARLLEVAGNDQAAALVSDVRSAVMAYLPDKDPWRKAAEAAAVRLVPARGAVRELDVRDRELLSNALRRAYDANAERYTQLRRFRNIMLGWAVVLALFATILSGVGALTPTAMPLCFEAVQDAAAETDDTDGTADTDATKARARVKAEAGTGEEGQKDASGGKKKENDEEQVCPSGGSNPSRGDAPMVALFGVVGGALGGVRSLTRSSRATVSSYTLRVARMALKVALGGAAAIVGLLFLRAGFAPGFSGLDSQHAILGWAVVFGASQQLVTRLADEQSEVVLKSASADVDSDSSDSGAED